METTDAACAPYPTVLGECLSGLMVSLAHTDGGVDFDVGVALGGNSGVLFRRKDGMLYNHSGLPKSRHIQDVGFIASRISTDTSAN